MPIPDETPDITELHCMQCISSSFHESDLSNQSALHEKQLRQVDKRQSRTHCPAGQVWTGTEANMQTHICCPSNGFHCNLDKDTSQGGKSLVTRRHTPTHCVSACLLLLWLTTALATLKAR